MLSRVFPNKKPTAQGKGLSSDYNESVMVRNLGSDAAFVIAAGMIITQGYAPADRLPTRVSSEGAIIRILCG